MIKSSTSKIYEQMEEKYHIFNTNMKQNPHVQMVQNMYDKGGQGVCKAELRPPEVDPYFERKKIALGGVTKSLQAAILTLEQNPPERKFLTYIKIFSQEDFALRSKLWPNNFL